MSKSLEALKVLVMSSTTIFNTKEQIEKSVKTIEKELKENEQCENVRKEWKCDIVKVNEMLRRGYWVKYGTNEKCFTYKHYVPNDESIICLRHLGHDVEICCITSKNEWNAPITGFNEISLSEYGTRLALTKEELEK